MARSKGRTGRPWRRVRAQVLAESDVCWLCGHPDANEVDHEPPLRELELHGLDPRDPRFLRPAHGPRRTAEGIIGCPHCGRMCNQEKGTGAAPALRTSRKW
ncbi:hypothetical protein [Nonomuraea dietziae]|uniref:hypothetical protein n=1 Tax=Nonomuraea dietziae TaxID=65515 RepID=UPI00342D121B